MKQGHVKHDEEVSEVMTELAEDYMPNCKWFSEEDAEKPLELEKPKGRQFASKVSGVRL